MDKVNVVDASRLQRHTSFHMEDSAKGEREGRWRSELVGDRSLSAGKMQVNFYGKTALYNRTDRYYTLHLLREP
ncbi:hypothetical protein RvY_03352 [Ramazzottius varieornatus]|uniref:Uncharacterized protein n=1 Tax=Ramazzottius varieornatus TaxID=947166 RepID=A0A1D1UMT0_RAMVA|nr:hypothetical protein RvY_03352 [Ramazzottius varieornatus]